jgi:hypothetical protein
MRGGPAGFRAGANRARRPCIAPAPRALPGTRTFRMPCACGGDTVGDVRRPGRGASHAASRRVRPATPPGTRRRVVSPASMDAGPAPVNAGHSTVNARHSTPSDPHSCVSANHWSASVGHSFMSPNHSRASARHSCMSPKHSRASVRHSWMSPKHLIVSARHSCMSPNQSSASAGHSRVSANHACASVRHSNACFVGSMPGAGGSRATGGTYRRPPAAHPCPGHCAGGRLPGAPRVRRAPSGAGSKTAFLSARPLPSLRGRRWRCAGSAARSPAARPAAPARCWCRCPG